MAANVLIVDNSEVMRDVLREAVSDEFHVVSEAEDGTEAIETVENGDIDVVLMDIVMPGVDGIEATATIKEIQPDVKVIFCTSVTQQDRMQTAIEAGGDGYIMKPFETSTVQEAIHNVVS